MLQLIQELKSFDAKGLSCDPWLSGRHISERYGVRAVDLAEATRLLDDGSVDGAIVAVPHREFATLPLSRAQVAIDIKGKLDGNYVTL